MRALSQFSQTTQHRVAVTAKILVAIAVTCFVMLITQEFVWESNEIEFWASLLAGNWAGRPGKDNVITHFWFVLTVILAIGLNLGNFAFTFATMKKVFSLEQDLKEKTMLYSTFLEGSHITIKAQLRMLMRESVPKEYHDILYNLIDKGVDEGARQWLETVMPEVVENPNAAEIFRRQAARTSFDAPANN